MHKGVIIVYTRVPACEYCPWKAISVRIKGIGGSLAIQAMAGTLYYPVRTCATQGQAFGHVRIYIYM